MASQFANNLLDILDQVEYRRVPFGSPEDEVYALRYRAYRHEAFVEPNAEERVYDPHDEAENIHCYGVYIAGELVSSVRFHHVTPTQTTSPSALVFPKELAQVLAEGKSYIDPSRFTTDVDARLQYPALPFLTLRIIAMACEYYDVDLCVSSVRPEHAAFYRRVFGSRRVEGSLGQYPGIDFDMHLYIAKVEEIRDRVAVRFPFFMSTREERQQLFGENRPRGIQSLVKPTARLAQSDEFEKPRI